MMFNYIDLLLGMIKEKSFLDPLFKWIVESKSVFVQVSRYVS